MNKLQLNSKKESTKEKILKEISKKKNKSLFLGSIIATFIALSPYFFYLHEHVPEERLWMTDWFTYDSKSWGDAYFAMWVFTNKFIPFLLLTIWFFTCRHWWYHVLFVPIAMYIYQIIGIFNDNIKYIDKFEIRHLIIVMAIFIPLTYLTRARLFDRINNVEKSVQELEDEIRLKPTGIFGFVKQYF